MWSSEIESLLEIDNNFIGCYPYDKLPMIESKNNFFSTIINTDSAKEKGDHWVAMRMTEKKCFYFDSFGVPILYCFY